MLPAHPIARLAAALVLAIQVALPMAAALAEAPPLRAGHEAHVSSAGAAECDPVHDELHCLLCRVLSADPLSGAVALAPSSALPEAPLPAPPGRLLPAPPGTPTVGDARAPPVS